MTLVALPAYLVRVAGFAYARLEPLRCSSALASAAVLDAAIAARLATGRTIDELLERETFPVTATFDRAARKQLVRHAQRVRASARELADLPDEALAAVLVAVPQLAIAELREHHAAWVAARDAYEREFATELERAREGLRSLYRDDPRLLESVFLESPEAYVGVRQLVATGGPRNSRARQRERLAMMYAQRFCAKNDTNSICGPLGVAYLDEPTKPTAIEVVTEDLRRETYFSYWAAQRLLDAALRRAGDAAPRTWQIQPSARLDADGVSWCTMDHDATSVFRRRYARSPLPPAGIALLRALASSHDARALAALAPSLELEVDELSEFVDELTAAGIVQRGPIVPPGMFYPLRAVAAIVEAWPDSEARAWALGEVAALTALVEAFGRAPLEQRVTLFETLSARFTEATGDAASRGEGKHYADRSVLHEDACIEVRAQLGAARVALERTLPSVFSAIELPLELARERVREWFRARYGEGVRIPALEAHRAFDTERVLETPATTERSNELRRAMDAVREVFARAAAGASGDRPAQLTTGELAAAVALAEAPQHPGYVSVDVMLRAREGAAAELVLGEVHGFFWLPTSFLDILPEHERTRVVELMRAAVRAMAGPTPTAECLFLHTQATDRRFPLATTDLQLIVRGDREGSHDLGELELQLVGDHFEFLHGDAEIIPLVAYTKYPFILYTSRIAPLFDDFAERFFPDSLVPELLREGDAPRIVVDNVVLRRRIWRRTASWLRARLSTASEAELVRTAQHVRRALGCDAQVFISIAGEPKPLLLDFANVFLLEAIAKIVESLPDDAAVKIGEMLPAGDELAARGPDGLRTSELRMGYYRT